MARTPWKIESVTAAACRSIVIALLLTSLGANQLYAQTEQGPLPPINSDDDEIPPELDILDELPPPSDLQVGTAINGLAGDEESSVLQASPQLDGPALLRSSGTWFRRGFWFAEQDVVVMTRKFTNRSFVLGFDATPGSSRSLIVDSGAAGVGTSARFTLGRFLYRDDENRDHLAEFTFLGLGEWNLQASIFSQNMDSLVTPFDPTLNGFNGTQTQRFSFESRFNSYEFNYRIRYRPRRDRIVLEPTGEWTRQIDPGNIVSYLFGVRLFSLDEDFRYIALSTVPGTRRGNLGVVTNNDLLGFQFGGDVIHQRARWSVGVRGKLGAYVNFASMNSDLVSVEAMVTTSDHKRADKDVLAFVGDLGVFAAYHFRPNVTFRIAFEALWANSIASAPKQIDLIVGTAPKIGTTAGLTYMGMSAGVNIYW